MEDNTTVLSVRITELLKPKSGTRPSTIPVTVSARLRREVEDNTLALSKTANMVVQAQPLIQGPH